MPLVLLVAASILALAQDSAQLDTIVAAYQKPGSPGCAFAAVKDGRVVHKGAYGMANLDHGIALNPSTVFHVASVSKEFTAASIALLSLDGSLSLDDPVRKYI